jgi:hypothetical protein
LGDVTVDLPKERILYLDHTERKQHGSLRSSRENELVGMYTKLAKGTRELGDVIDDVINQCAKWIMWNVTLRADRNGRDFSGERVARRESAGRMNWRG